MSGFQRWALGNLTGNLNRGLFAEWLVGTALGVIKDGDARAEWGAFDLRYGNVTIEVKASGRSQDWNRASRSTPRFDIAPRKWTWDAAADTWKPLNPPRRLADVYVFCLHNAEPATNENVQDPDCWTFWVIPTRKLNEELGEQKSLGLSTLDSLTNKTRVDRSEIRSVLDTL
ncbi:MAG: hypothetical protein OXJ55_11590 [Caldilineaceae bacterium]|nr:hypothetical protein [Caldilineaceae bacterium]MDE0500875.1 hypothetical protein [bacterium]